MGAPVLLERIVSRDRDASPIPLLHCLPSDGEVLRQQRNARGLPHAALGLKHHVN
jgi:hypothetical protein